MSVLIRDMNIPKDRQLLLSIDEKGQVYIYGEYPTKLYKAIEVPPGRLIDANALINALQELFDRRKKDAEYMGFCGAFVNWNDAICYIKDAPTIIEAESEA